MNGYRRQHTRDGEKNWPENKVGLGWNLTWQQHSSGDLLTDMYLYTIYTRACDVNRFSLFRFFFFSFWRGFFILSYAHRRQMASTWREFLKWKIYTKRDFPYRPSSIFCFLSFPKRTDQIYINENIFSYIYLLFEMLLCKKKWAGISYIYVLISINGTHSTHALWIYICCRPKYLFLEKCPAAVGPFCCAWRH